MTTGTRAAVLTLGVNIDYPRGTPDHLVVALNSDSAGPTDAEPHEGRPQNVWTQIALRLLGATWTT